MTLGKLYECRCTDSEQIRIGQDGAEYCGKCGGVRDD